MLKGKKFLKAYNAEGYIKLANQVMDTRLDTMKATTNSTDSAAQNGTYEPTYWFHEGEHQRLAEYVQDHMVPAKGEADTELGEAARHLANFYYERFNNGHINGTKEERTFLRNHFGGRFAVQVKMSDRELDETMDRFFEFVADKLGGVE